jgi:hypothetical protein
MTAPLTDEQKKTVSSWIEGGAKLSEIQDRLDKELGVRLTYMDVRLLADDLKVTPKDAEPPAPPAVAPASNTDGPADLPAEEPADVGPDAPLGGGSVSLTVDQLARPGAMVSGKVTFSDGKKADWYMDQYGRLGLVGPQPGYRPPSSDIPEFQAALDRELAKMGL